MVLELFGLKQHYWVCTLHPYLSLNIRNADHAITSCDDRVATKDGRMGSVAVENPLDVLPPHKKPTTSNLIPNLDSLEGIGSDDNDEYSALKKLQRHLE